MVLIAVYCLMNNYSLYLGEDFMKRNYIIFCIMQSIAEIIFIILLKDEKQEENYYL